MKKTLFSLIILATVSLFSVCTSAQVPKFSIDGVTDDYSAALFLQDKGLLHGDGNGDLMLDQKLTREQMMVIISRLLNKESEAQTYPVTNLTFKDVPKTSFYAPYIAWAKANKITDGYNENTFGLGDYLTDYQTQAFIIRLLGHTDTPYEMVGMQFSDSIYKNDPETYKTDWFQAFSSNDEYITREHLATYVYFALYTDGLSEKIGALPSSNNQNSLGGIWKSTDSNDAFGTTLEIKNYTSNSFDFNIGAFLIVNPNNVRTGVIKGKAYLKGDHFEFTADKDEEWEEDLTGKFIFNGDALTVEYDGDTSSYAGAYVTFGTEFKKNN